MKPNGLSYDFGVENVGDFSAVEIKLVKYKTNILQSEMPRWIIGIVGTSFIIILLILNQIIMYKFSKIKPPYSEFSDLNKSKIESLKSTYKSSGIINSTLSNDGISSEIIKS